MVGKSHNVVETSPRIYSSSTKGNKGVSGSKIGSTDYNVQYKFPPYSVFVKFYNCC